jgi:carbonic anhydrase
MKILLLPLALFTCISHAALCESGHRQSPINILTQSVAAKKLPAMTPDYQAAPLKAANDGHTLRVRFDKSGQLLIGKERYTLQQFHFHTPGGDQINGENFPFAAHILHKSASGQLLAIVVPFRLGADNPLLTRLLPHIPAKADGDHKHPDMQVNAKDLLPSDLAYYRYSGSLTAAPCTEGVEWLVMKHPLTLSAAQLATWQQHFKDNMRGVNPLFGRAVFESQ